MSSSSIPAWATVDEESNNLYYRALGAGAPADGLLFKSSAAMFLEERAAKDKCAQHLLDVVTDRRLKYFDPEVNTNVKSAASTKTIVRNAYANTCLLCGKAEGVASWPLTVAHIVAHNSGFNYTEFGPPRYADDCDPKSIRNRVLLCGTKTDYGSCHNMFDHHNVIIYYDGFESAYKSLCLVPILNTAHSTAKEVRVLKFPSTFDSSKLPYRRLLAWRIRHAAVKHADILDQANLDLLVRMSEFSEAAEIATDDELVDEDEDTRLPTVDSVADALENVDLKMSVEPAFSSEVGSPRTK